MAELRRDSRWADLVKQEETLVHAAYESVFHHHAFTGRSGAMFAYEGLGCVYWHMVSKLLLGIQEAHARAVAQRDQEATELARAYHETRAGLGFNKSPIEWGAFPTDPYSHTPGHAGAQQPGMTGQAKEGVLTRLGELGVVISGGVVRFDPRLLAVREFATSKYFFAWTNARNQRCEIELPPGTLAFTLWGTLVVYTLASGSDVKVSVHRIPQNGDNREDVDLGGAEASALFARSAKISRLEVLVGRDRLWNE